ncbi:type II secretion system GspH family protein [Patescibacteria group bacterium]|nr:type II secretion system GspH family protein [Patescibacteria group bacterium]
MFSKRKAFTIVELLITFSIFTIVVAISVLVMFNTLKSAKRIRAQVYLYTETQALMDTLVADIQRNGIDYEGYYARRVKGETTWAGNNYGQYGQTFFSPGSGGPLGGGPYAGVTGYGAFCSDGLSAYPDDCPSTLPISSSLDTNTGSHPFLGITAMNPSYIENTTFMNAFCESADGSGQCESIKNNKNNELLLINEAGDERTIILREKLKAGSVDLRLSKAVLRGLDTDNDGIEDAWTCSNDYDCTGPDGGPAIIDLVNTDNPQRNFLPLSPSAINVEEFYVYIAPLEDPYHAFGESDFATQLHPQVTIILTTSLAEAFSQGIIGENPTITIQRTVSTGVFSEVVSYE